MCSILVSGKSFTLFHWREIGSRQLYNKKREKKTDDKEYNFTHPHNEALMWRRNNAKNSLRVNPFSSLQTCKSLFFKQTIKSRKYSLFVSFGTSHDFRNNDMGVWFSLSRRRHWSNAKQNVIISTLSFNCVRRKTQKKFNRSKRKKDMGGDLMWTAFE